MANMTKKGARSVTAELDRVASLFQTEFSTLGVSQNDAIKFATMCDSMSDAVEQKAGIARQALSELDVNKEKGFDPETIGEEVSGPIEGDADESFMKGEFTQQERRELRERVQDGDLGMKTNPEEQAPQAGKQASVDARLASACGKLINSSATVSNAVVANSIAKLAMSAMGVHLAHQAGMATSATAERALTALNHVLSVASSGNLAKAASAVALAHKVLAADMVDEEKPEDKPEEKNEKKGGEIPPQFLENIKKKKDEAGDKEDKDEDKEGSKKASHGFNLFA